MQQLLTKLGGKYVGVSSAALGQRFFTRSPQGDELGPLYPKGCEPKAIRKWRIATDCEEFVEVMTPFSAVPELPAEVFTECRGKIAKDSGRYAEKLAQLFWATLRPVQPDPQHDAIVAGDGPPIWQCLITRKVGLKTEEAKSEPALKAKDKELSGHRARGTRSEDHVREPRDLTRDDSVPEFMLGRVFGVPGVKNAEDPQAADYKFRTVFQGNNVRTKTGLSAVDLYQEVSSSPCTFSAIRALLAMAVLMQLTVSVCDALQAYFQARIDQPGRVPTYVELPRDWWPSSWFHDGDPNRPKYVRPVCPLCRALYGHPEAGALWSRCSLQFLEILGGLLCRRGPASTSILTGACLRSMPMTSSWRPARR